MKPLDLEQLQLFWDIVEERNAPMVPIDSKVEYAEWAGTNRNDLQGMRIQGTEQPISVVRELHQPPGKEPVLYEGTIKNVTRRHHEQWHGLVRKTTAKFISIELFKEGNRIADFRFKLDPVIESLGADRCNELVKKTGDDLIHEQNEIADMGIDFKKASPYAYEDIKGILTDRITPVEFQLKKVVIGNTQKCELCGKMLKASDME